MVMATTIHSALQQFRSNLEITDLQETTVSTRQQSVRAAVARDLAVLDSFLTGSYSRNTLIAPLKDADIDIFVILDPQYYWHYNGQNGGQRGLLDLVKSVLRKTYPSTPDISRNGQAVTIRFTDFDVDVVPGFNREGGGYLIPNTIGQTWIETDPKKHVVIMADSNRWHEGNLVPLVKMLKGWNRSKGSFFQSFHLEVMALYVLTNVRISDFPSGLRYVFDKCREYVTQKNLDPAGYGGDVASYINTQVKIKEAANRFQAALEKALQAEDHARRGYVTSAFDAWRALLGDYFPAYG